MGVTSTLANQVEPENFCKVKLSNASPVTPEGIKNKTISGGHTSLLSPDVNDTVNCCDSKAAALDEAVPLVPSVYGKKTAVQTSYL